MHIRTLHKGMTLVAMMAGLMVGCGDEDTNDVDAGDAGTESAPSDHDGGHSDHDAGHSDGGDEDGATGGDEDGTTGGDEDGTTGGDEDETTGGDEDETTGGDEDETTGGDEDEDSIPELPAAISLSGCESFGVGPLCTVTQDDAGGISANCGGMQYTGEIALDGDVTLTGEPTTSRAGAPVSTTCEGKFARGRLVGECTQSTEAFEDTPESVSTCGLRSKAGLLPGVACMQLPAELTDVVICKEGAATEGKTLEFAKCEVIQDGCNFQALCGDAVLTGEVGATDLSFSPTLVAMADAAVALETDEPAFAKGDEVAFDCIASVEGKSLVGSCEAGSLRRRGEDPIPATSVCAVEAAATEVVPVCDSLAPEDHMTFVLDSCDILKEGEGAMPGIGEPVCTFQQSNCAWQIQCGPAKNGLVYGGVLKPAAKKAEWKLATGTPCELGFNAEGKASGECKVAGEEACALGSIPAVPGGEGCDALLDGADFSSRGCGGQTGVVCKTALQHGCNFMGVCEFSGRYPDSVVAGSMSVEGGQGQMEFNGFNGFACSVTEPTEEQISSGDRAANEWIGQCMNAATGGMCRDTWELDPETGEWGGWRGLQVFIGQPPVQPED